MRKIKIFAIFGLLSIASIAFAQETELSTKGYRGFLELGGGSLWMQHSNAGADVLFHASTTHGVQICKYFYTGAGVGYEGRIPNGYNDPANGTNHFIPLYANFRGELPHGNFIPALDVKLGNEFILPIDGWNYMQGNLYFKPSVVFAGVINHNLLIGVSLGYGLVRYYGGYLSHSALFGVELSWITGKE